MTSSVTGSHDGMSDAYRRAGIAAHAADDKKGAEIVVLDVGDIISIVEVFVFVSASNTRLVRTIVDEIELALKIADDEGPRSVEGLGDATWVLMDYGDVIVHVFQSETREFYDLDRLWADAPRVEWTALPAVPDVRAAVPTAQRAAVEVRAHRHVALGEAGLELAHTDVAVEARGVEDRADDRGLRAACGQPVGDVVDVARATRRDHGDVHRVGDGARDVEVVARRGAVVVDAVDDDLSRAEVLAASHPVEGVESGGEARAVDEHLVAARDAVADADVLHLRAQHHALPPERVARRRG